MAIKTYNDQNFVAIANAIRAKNGETTQYKPSEMAPAIMAIESGLELLPQDTVAGAIANFPDGSNNYPVVELIANIEPKQSGSGDPSPSNVRPISGYTGMNITRSGKNMLSSASAETKTDKSVTVICDGEGTYTLSGTATGGSANIRFSLLTPTKIVKGTYMHLKNNPYNAVSSITFEREDLSSIFNYALSPVDRIIDLSSYVGEEIANIRFYIANEGSINSVVSPMISASSTSTDFEPYQAPEVKTISWESEAGTVYGGTLNVTTGELTVTHKLVTYTGAESESWTYEPISGNSRFRTIVPDVKISSAGRNQVISNIGNFSASINAPFVIFIYSNGANKLLYYYPGNDITTAEDFKTWLSSNNMQVVYELNTPETYQLTPEEVKTLLGVNNIYADTGNVEVTYRADIDLYIAKKIAEGA